MFNICGKSNYISQQGYHACVAVHKRLITKIHAHVRVIAGVDIIVETSKIHFEVSN